MIKNIALCTNTDIEAFTSNKLYLYKAVIGTTLDTLL